MAFWYTNSVAWTAMTAWAALTAKSAGNLVRQNAAPTVGNERAFVCIVAGTTLAAEPTWVITKGAQTAEAAGPTWQECTGQPGVNGDLTNCPAWTAIKNTSVALGYVIQNVAGTYLFICSTAGTAGNGSEPSWTLTAGVTTSDNTITWTCIGAVGNFGNRAAPFARLQSDFPSTWGASLDTFFIDDNSAETQAAAMTMTSPALPTGQCNILCVSHSTVPPATVTTGASISTTGASSMTITQGGVYDGITFNCGSGANSATFAINPNAVRMAFKNCAFKKIATTAATTAYSINNSGSLGNQVEWTNTTIQVGNTGDSIAFNHGGHLIWRDTPSAITGSIFPSSLFNASASHGLVEMIGVDISALGANKIYGTGSGSLIVVMTGCKLGAGYVPGTPQAAGGRLDIINCDSGATNYENGRYQVEGQHTVATNVVRYGGAVEGSTALSWQVSTSANSSFVNFFECMPLPINNTVLSTNRVVTVYGIVNSASLPNNDQIWLRVNYLGSSASPQFSVATATKANVLAAGTALTADSTSNWSTAAAARINSQSYGTLGSAIIVSSSTLLFFCTATGTSASSLPAGYASAVDGGSVTDGSATFRAGTRFSMSVTLSSPQPAQTGYLYAYVRAALPSSIWYVDPEPVLS